MTFDQIFLLSLLGAVLGLFMWGKLRHDLVAVLALLAATLAGKFPCQAPLPASRARRRSPLPWF